MRLALLLTLAWAGVAVACGQAAPAAVREQHTAAPPRSAPHFVDSYPNHGDVYTEAPRVVRVNFDFALQPRSTISIRKNGSPVEVGQKTLSENMISMSVAIHGNPGDGEYLVQYKSCWADQSCSDGEFAFRVDAKRLVSYKDLTGQPEVTVIMRGIKFEDPNIVVSKGAKVTWFNAEAAPHFVNTDPHPSHNGLRSLNSLDVNQGQTYSYVFDESGEWGYHCSAHVPQGMVGRVVVR